MAVTVTARSLIVGVFRLLGITAQGEDPSADEILEAYARLNEMIDRWGTQRLTMRVVSRHVVDLTANVGTYTIGPDVTAPNFTLARPTVIDNVQLELRSSTPYTEIPLSVLTEQTYQGLQQKSLTNSQPTAYYFEATMPAATLILWPVPDTAANGLVLYVPEAMNQFPSLHTEVVLAPGYTSAVRYNLARELSDEYGRELPPRIAQLAAESLSNIKTLNVPMMDLGVDPGLLPVSGRYGYNINTDVS